MNRKPPNAGKGRRKGVPNKTTADVRATIALIAERNIQAFEDWLLEIKDPEKRCNVYLRAIEYHVPKLTRSEVTGEGGGPVLIQATETDRSL